MAAETFLFNIAHRVLGKLGSLALQEVCLALGLKIELENLQSTISTIQAVLLDAEEQQAKNRQLTNWLGKIKDALYDADDVLDEFQYEDLRKQAVNHGEIKRKGVLKLKHRAMADDARPIDPGCACMVCKNYTRAYIHSLDTKDAMGSQLLSYHNLFYMMKLSRDLHSSIIQGRFPEFVCEFLQKMIIS